MKKPFEEPVIVIEFFSETDVITTSGGGFGGDPIPGDDEGDW